MKYLITGNHACANRGDAAILRGLLHFLDNQPDVSYDFSSRHPDSASFFLQKKAQTDTLYQHRKTHRGTIWQKLYWRLQPYYLVLLITLFDKKPREIKRWLPGYMRRQVEQLAAYDAVIQVGGSFFVDIYGTVQFEDALCAIAAGKPLYLAGHSIGPFNGRAYRIFSQFIFKHTSWCGLREQLSASRAAQAAISLNNPVIGADTAWLVPTPTTPPDKTNTIAITVRDITPFSQRLGISQQEYETAIAKLADSLVSQNYQVAFYSTCTGIDSYANDDRMVAWRIRNLCQQLPLPDVEMRELNDVELGMQLASCRLTVATRLHSAIISMNFGTAAIAINYEHKSAGIYTDMDLASYAFDMAAVKNGQVVQAVSQALADEQLAATFAHAVQEQRNTAQRFMADMLKHSLERSGCK